MTISIRRRPRQAARPITRARWQRGKGLWTISIALFLLSGCYSHALHFPAPSVTSWAPQGCRRVVEPANDLAGGPGWRNIHAGSTNSDAVDVVITPTFKAGWVAEPHLWSATSVVFDRSGNIYFTPLFPHEEVILLSLDSETGRRRWATPGTGTPVGTGSPMLLDDPESPGDEIVYVGLYDRAVAVRTSGETVWDVPTGLGQDGEQLFSVFGINFVPSADALIAVAANGRIYALDRSTGATLLDSPFDLPGAPSITRPLSPELTPEVLKTAQSLLEPFLALPPGVGLETVLHALLGEGRVVPNAFAVDPSSGAIYIAATAPDASDGSRDGISEMGALYRLDLSREGANTSLRETCRHTFQGGSATSPSLSTDGQRIYVGDSEGKILALTPQCEVLWTLDLGEQISASIGVSPDDDELYTVSNRAVTKLVDRGEHGEIIWRTEPEIYELGLQQHSMNVQVLAVAANGIGFQGAAGVTQPGARAPLPLKTGMGVLDRETGAVRFFADGLDESVGVVSTNHDGTMVIGHSPFRRTFVRALRPMMTEKLTGGVRKWEATRPELVVRDALCAAAARRRNAIRNEKACPSSAKAEMEVVGQLVAQAEYWAARMEPSDPDLVAELSARHTPAEVNRLASLCAELTAMSASK